MSTLNVEHLKHENSSSNNITLDSDGSVAFDTSTLYVDAVNNRVGISNGSPTATLNVGTGYATFQMGANDSTGFHWAKDNTALNLYTGSVGSGARRFGVDTSGRVTMPDQPAFFSYRAAAGNVTYSAGAVVSADMTSTRFNVGNHYNTSNGRFTAPIAGLYFFSANIYNNSLSALRVFVAVNGSAIFGKGNMAAANQYTTVGVIKLGAGDYADVRVDYNDTIVFHDISHSTFSGYLIG